MVEWRSYEEDQQKLQQEQSAIELKQKQHLEEYRKERAGLWHLSWRQRKYALYQTNKNKFAVRPSERTQSDEMRLPLIIKGRDRETMKMLLSYRSLSVSMDTTTSHPQEVNRLLYLH